MSRLATIPGCQIQLKIGSRKLLILLDTTWNRGYEVIAFKTGQSPPVFVIITIAAVQALKVTIMIWIEQNPKI